MTYDQAMSKYGCDKPDIRFAMELIDLNDVSKHKDFNVFNSSELVIGIRIEKGIHLLENRLTTIQIGLKDLKLVLRD